MPVSEKLPIPTNKVSEPEHKDCDSDHPDHDEEETSSKKRKRSPKRSSNANSPSGAAEKMSKKEACDKESPSTSSGAKTNEQKSDSKKRRSKKRKRRRSSSASGNGNVEFAPVRTSTQVTDHVQVNGFNKSIAGGRVPYVELEMLESPENASWADISSDGEIVQWHTKKRRKIIDSSR